MAIELFDTTLRDGTQAHGINLSVKDKLRITSILDEFGIDIIEGGWPGSNPIDEEYFRSVRTLNLKHARICAFGSTARRLNAVESDPNLNALLETGTDTVSIFGKAWRFHSQQGLGISDDDNRELIYNSIVFMVGQGREVVFDAEHFFDGYCDDPQFAMSMVRAAEEAGATTIVLCDTNGGMLPGQINEIVREVGRQLKTALGIHAHNDSEMAVANTIIALENGVTHVQGTINGLGERCGNANLCSVIPAILLKQGVQTIGDIDLARLSEISRSVAELMNISPPQRSAYVGQTAFSHKGGIHVSAVMKNSAMYEHIDPELVGATRQVLVSDLAGRSNIRYKAKELGIDLDDQNGSEQARKIVTAIKDLEYAGYQFDGAEASFELIMRQHTGEFTPYFEVLDSRVYVRYGENMETVSEAVLKVRVDGEIEHTVAEGVGPVNALDVAVRKALTRFYPVVAQVKLVDYKVRVLDEKDGTSAKVRVLIETTDGGESWFTVGVSENIIEASWQAIRDSLNIFLFRQAAVAATLTAAT